MDAQKAILVAIIIVLFAALGFELKVIEDVLRAASLQADEQCADMCIQKGEIPYIADGSCFCKEPVSFRRQLRCLSNVTFENDTMFSAKFNATGVRDIAVKSVVGYPSPNSLAARIFGIYNAVSNRIYYVSDPRKDEYVADPMETWEARGGDCDDFSVLLASMYEAVGLDASIVEVYNTTYGHAFIIAHVEQDLDSFLNSYKSMLDKYTPYFSEKQFSFLVLAKSDEECAAAARSVESGGSLDSFYIIVESTASDYPGSSDAFDDYDGYRFIKVDN